jgi:hypothetical protein
MFEAGLDLQRHSSATLPAKLLQEFAGPKTSFIWMAKSMDVWIFSLNQLCTVAMCFKIWQTSLANKCVWIKV